MNEELRKDIRTIAEHAQWEGPNPVVDAARRLLLMLDMIESPVVDKYGLRPLENPTPTGETVRVRAGVYWDDTQKEWLVFGTLRRLQSGDTIITEIFDLELNGLICKQADPKGNHYRLWVKSLVGSPIATIEAPIPLPRIPVVDARVVEGGEA